MDNVQCNVPPLSRAASSMTFWTSTSHPAPSLIAGSTHSSSKSALTNDIKITSNPPLDTMMAKKEAKEAHIEVGDSLCPL